MPKPKQYRKTEDEDPDEKPDLGFDEEFDIINWDDAEEVDTGYEEVEVEDAVTKTKTRVRKKVEAPAGKLPLALCHKCTLIACPMVPSFGPDDAKVILVGEAPGQEETVEKRPFVGISGKLLRSVVSVAGYDLDDAFLTNAVACRPPANRTPKAIEVKCCRPRLLDEIAKHTAAESVVAMGKVANKVFNKNFQPADRGLWSHDEVTAKYLMGTWHPSYVLRKPSSAVQFIPDIRKGFEGRKAVERFHKPPEVIVISDLTHLRYELAKATGFVAFDLETDNVIWYDRPSKKADSIILMAVAWCDDYSIIIDDALLYDTPGIREELVMFCARKDLTFCAHNGKFDQLFLLSHLNIKTRLDFDTMLAHYILDENSPHGLKLVAREQFGLFDYEKEIISKYLTTRNDSYSKIPFPELSLYASWDVIVTRALAIKFMDDLKRDDLYDMPFMNPMMAGSEMFVDAEYRGIQTDMSYLPRARDAMEKELDLLEAEAFAYHDGLNMNAPGQVMTFMYDVLKIPVPTIDGVPWRSSARAAVNALVGKHPFVDLLIYYRRIGKLKSSYIENMLMYGDVNGKLHPTFWLHGTEMGRLSARNPAIQTIPRPGDKWIETVGTRSGPLTDGALIRGSICASPGNMLVVSDYSQAELRTAACLAHEPFLMSVYENDRDLHTEVAVAMYGPNFQKEERQRCKMFNFSYLYGGNEYSFAKDAGLDIRMAQKFVRDYNKVMPRLATYRVEQYNKMLQQGYVETLFKRRRRFVLITDRNKDDVRKACVHAPVAGTASDLTLISAIRVWRQGVPVIMTVHDSVIADVPVKQSVEVGAYVEETMRQVGSEYLPEVPWKSDTEIVTHWSEAPVL